MSSESGPPQETRKNCRSGRIELQKQERVEEGDVMIAKKELSLQVQQSTPGTAQDGDLFLCWRGFQNATILCWLRACQLFHAHCLWSNGKLILWYFTAKKKTCQLDLDPYTRVLSVRECAFICDKMIKFLCCSFLLFFKRDQLETINKKKRNCSSGWAYAQCKPGLSLASTKVTCNQSRKNVLFAQTEKRHVAATEWRIPTLTCCINTAEAWVVTRPARSASLSLISPVALVIRHSLVKTHRQ